MYNGGNLTLNSIVRKVSEKIDVGSNDKLRHMVTINFDDGYRSHYDIGFDLMKKYNMRGTYFITAWNNREPGHDPERWMLEEHIQEVSFWGNEIGEHTRTHAHLTDLTREEILDEWLVAKERIEAMTGIPVKTTAYPAGRNNDEINDMASMIYESSRGTHHGITQNPFDVEIGERIARFNIYGRSLYNISATQVDSISAQNVIDIIDHFLELPEPCLLNFYMHQLFEDGDPEKPENRQSRTQLETWLSYLSDKKKEGLVDVVPYIEAVRRLNGARSAYL